MKKAFTGPKQRSAFRDNYLAAVITVAALFCSFISIAQSGPTRTELQQVNAKGYDYQSGAYRKLFYVPLDTLSTADSGAIAYINGIFYLKNHHHWVPWGKAVQITDSSFRVGEDTIVISGTGGGSVGSGYGITVSSGTAKLDTLTVDKRYRKVFPVTTFGADPDSNGTDDCPAIRAAVQAAYDAGGGIVYFPLGHYTAGCPLIRSQDGVDPRAQIVIPLTQAATSEYQRITFEGELPGNFSAEIVAGLNLPKNRKGVIIESTILDTGYIFGSSFYNVTELGGPVNYTWVEFKNIEVRTRTKTSGSEISGTMSGIDMNAPRSVNFDFVKVTNQSAETDLIEPYTGTYGVRLPHYNNNAHITGTTLTVTGYYTGVIGAEHMNFKELVTATCHDGLVLTPANHSGYVGQYTSEGCVNHIRVLDSSLFSGAIQPMDLHIANYNVEHYTSGGAWNAYSSDVLYDDTSSGANVVIDYAHVAISGVGESYVFNTNAPHKVFVLATPVKPNVLLNRQDGHYVTTFPSTSTIDGNIIQLGDNTSSIGISAGLGDGFGQGFGGWLAMRGDAYTANSGQRGWLTIGGGSPSTPTGPEGGVSLFTALAERLRIFYNGNTQIGSTGTDDGGLLQVGKSTNGYNVYNFSNTNTGASARQALVLRGDNANGYLDFELHNTNAGNEATLTGGSALSAFRFLSTGNYPIQFHTNSDGSSNLRMTISGSGTITMASLAGSGTRMVTANASGDLSTTTLPSADGNGIYSGSGTLPGNVNVSGASNALSLGTFASQLSGFSIWSAGSISLNGQVKYTTADHSADADFTVPANVSFVELHDNLTTDRTLTLPTASAQGQTITIVVRASAGTDNFNLSAGVPDNKTGSTFTQLDWGTTYVFYVNASVAWSLINKY